MANLLGSFRQQLAADLQLRFPDATVHQGERSGMAAETDMATVVWAGFGEQGDQVVVGEARFLVRYWPATAKVKADAPAGVRDPATLEQAAIDLAEFLQTKQTSYTGVWYCRLVSVTPDYAAEEWGVEAELLVVCTNPAVI